MLFPCTSYVSPLFLRTKLGVVRFKNYRINRTGGEGIAEESLSMKSAKLVLNFVEVNAISVLYYVRKHTERLQNVTLVRFVNVMVGTCFSFMSFANNL